MTESPDTTSLDTIPLANLRRLDLKPGDRLAVIAPDWITSARDMGEFAKLVSEQVAEVVGVRALVLPPGTKLETVSPQQQPEPRPFEYPVGGAPVAPADPARQIQQP